MHWPDCAVLGRSNKDVRAETWRALEEMYDEGECVSPSCLLRVWYFCCGSFLKFDGGFGGSPVPTGLCHSIGVSNFLIPHLEDLKEDGGVMPHVNQVRTGSRLVNRGVHGTLVTARCSHFAGGVSSVSAAVGAGGVLSQGRRSVRGLLSPS